MNIKNLVEFIEENGNVLRNYRHLCEVLGIKPKGGNQKKAQMKEIERFISLSKGKGYRLIVDEVYETAKPKEGNNIYGGLVQLLLTDYFMKTKKSQLVHTTGYLMQQVSMINKNYRINKRDVTEYSLEMNIDKDIIHDFYDTTDATLGSAIETALRNLENRAIILFTTEYIVDPIGESGHRLATNEERAVILSTRRKLLEKYGYKTLGAILFSKDQYRFIDETNRILSEEIKVNRAYKGYNINILQESIAQQQAEMIISHLSNIESKSHKDELNNLVVSRLLQNAINRQKSVNELIKANEVESAFGDGKMLNVRLNSKQIARKSEGYIESMEKILNDNIVSDSLKVEVEKLCKNGDVVDLVEQVFS